MMITKTTVKGYTIQRITPFQGERERWAVDKDRLHYGYIAKVSYLIKGEGKIVNFWICISEKRYGHMRYITRKVADTRTEIIFKLAKLREGKKDATIN